MRKRKNISIFPLKDKHSSLFYRTLETKKNFLQHCHCISPECRDVEKSLPALPHKDKHSSLLSALLVFKKKISRHCLKNTLAYFCRALEMKKIGCQHSLNKNALAYFYGTLEMKKKGCQHCLTKNAVAYFMEFYG